MNALLHIRKDVLRISQVEMARIADTTQATISRWERGELHPDLPQMVRIRDEALRSGAAWSDALFFQSSPDVPDPMKPQPSAPVTETQSGAVS